jgi:hypothetical protein
MIIDDSITARSEDVPVYSVDVTTQAEDQIIARGLTILAGRMRTDREVFSSPTTVRHYCQLRLGALDHEVFAVLLLLGPTGRSGSPTAGRVRQWTGTGPPRRLRGPRHARRPAPAQP